MKVIVFGATGPTGKHLIQQAVERGHQVRAFVRTVPGKHDPQVDWFEGNVLDERRVLEALKGQQGVLSALGPRDPSTPVCAPGIQHILRGMRLYGSGPLVALSAYGTQEHRGRGTYSTLLWTLLPWKMQDKEGMEKHIQNSGLAWTILRPPALTGSPGKGHYQLAADLPISLFSRISRPDLARCMLDVLQPGFAGQTLTVKG